MIVDVVYNHLGPSDLDLWRFDGWSEGDGGGIYFYNDERAVTPWGATRPDYGRGEVRTFLRDSAMTWLEEFRCDGLRFDSTVHIRTFDGDDPDPASALPDGWSFLAWINDEIRTRQPWKITIAEDLQDDRDARRSDRRGRRRLRGPVGRWLHRRVRPALVAADDARSGPRGRRQPGSSERGAAQPLSRVIYTESHDEVANGRTRVPEAIAPGDADSWWAKKRAVLGSALVLTSPGIPMLFQGQELLEDRWFDDTVALDWEKASTNRGILRLHRDLIALRRARDGATLGLRGSNVAILRADQEAKRAGHAPLDGRRAARRHRRRRELRRSDARRPADRVPGTRVAGTSGSTPMRRAYAPDFGSHEVFDLDADGPPLDGCEQSGLVSVGPYSVVILSRED